MKSRRRRLLRSLFRPTAILATLGFIAVLSGVGRGSSRTPNLLLVAGTNFSVTSSISDSATVENPALLYPGGPRYLWYTVHNPLSAQITVSTLSTGLDSPVPSTCSASNLDLSQTTFSGSLIVPGGSTNKVSVPISLRETGVNQDGCKNVTFHFVYTGTATYTQVFATTTGLTSSPNPSTLGQSVTFTATVTPTGTPPSGPTGTVNFVSCPTTACSTSSPLGSGSLLPSGQATFATSSLPSGTNFIRATYLGDGSNFSASTSSVVSQVVNNFATATALTSSFNPSTFGQAVTFTATVTSSSGTPAGQLTFFDGTTSLGAFTLDALGKATLTTSTLTAGTHPIKAVYAGNGTFLASTSSVVNQVVNYTSCITGTVGGGLTVANGQSICITSTGRVNGAVVVQAGGILSVNGGSVNSTLTVQSNGMLVVNGGSLNGVNSTGAKSVTICGATLKGDLSVSGTTGFVRIGDTSAGCAVNTLSNVTISTNSAGFVLGGNSIGNSVSVTSNVDGRPSPPSPQIKGNQIKGSLSCSGNVPAPTNGGQPNTVKGSRFGQCSGAGF